jgi:hypothetical protein
MSRPTAYSSASAGRQQVELVGLDLEQTMNYVPDLFYVRREAMVRAVVAEAVTLASLALFVGMIAIWAQVIATL